MIREPREFLDRTSVADPSHEVRQSGCPSILQASHWHQDDTRIVIRYEDGVACRFEKMPVPFIRFRARTISR
jgi:hypothetical protein